MAPRLLLSFLVTVLSGSFPVGMAEESHSIPPPASAYIGSLSIHPKIPGLLFAASPGGGLYRSIDAAASWQHIDAAPGVDDYNVVLVDAVQSSRVFAGGKGTGVYVSDDLGDTWRNAGPDGVTVVHLALDPSHPGRVWALAPEGVWRTDDISTPTAWRLVWDYTAWRRAHHQPEWTMEEGEFTRFQKITVNPHHPGTVLVGARWEGGYHRSDDAGETWRHESLNGLFRRADYVLVDPSRPGVLLAGTHHQGMFKSYNDGRSWVVTGRNLIPQRRTPHYGVYLMGDPARSPHDPDTLFVGSDYSSWKSVDGGDSWEELGRTLTCEFARAFAVSPQDPNVVYAGTNVGAYKSIDGGTTWTPANRGFPERDIRQTLDVELDGETWRYAIMVGQPAVYRRSVTRDTDWRSMSWLLYREVDHIRWEAATHELVLTTPEGEVRSRDGGFRWDLPEVTYAHRELSNLKSDNPSPPVGEGTQVIIVGAAVPDDSLVDALYQRPPFVSLQLVTRDYPQDGSIPRWSVLWDRALQGRINPPANVVRDGIYDLYVEVRDFQDGTRTGRTRYAADRVLRVAVKPVHAREGEKKSRD